MSEDVELVLCPCCYVGEMLRDEAREYEEDAKVGRAVSLMPPDCSLIRSTRACWAVVENVPQGRYGDGPTPLEALKSAGLVEE